MLTVDNITCNKNQQIIFNNLGFSIGLGTGLIITGTNGSGKTTLLRTIAGLSQPSSGTILWNNQNVKELYAEFSADINYIGHKNFLKPKLTVLQNLNFYAALSGTEILIPAAIKYFGLEQIIDTPIYKLSSGWQKKVILSKLLYCPATIWLLDEPSVNLDVASKELLFNLISTKVADGGIVIIATHDEIFFPLGSAISLKDFQSSS